MSYSEEEQKEMTQPFRFLSARNNKRQLGKKFHQSRCVYWEVEGLKYRGPYALALFAAWKKVLTAVFFIPPPLLSVAPLQYIQTSRELEEKRETGPFNPNVFPH